MLYLNLGAIGVIPMVFTQEKLEAAFLEAANKWKASYDEDISLFIEDMRNRGKLIPVQKNEVVELCCLPESEGL